jgi:hypothetical protein
MGRELSALEGDCTGDSEQGRSRVCAQVCGRRVARLGVCGWGDMAAGIAAAAAIGIIAAHPRAELGRERPP